MLSGERDFLESDSSVERGILFCLGLHKVKHREHNYGSPTHKIPIAGDRLIPANKLINRSRPPSLPSRDGGRDFLCGERISA